MIHHDETYALEICLGYKIQEYSSTKLICTVGYNCIWRVCKV